MKVQLKTIPVKPSIEGLEIAQLIIANHKLQGWRVIQTSATSVTLKRVSKPA